ncbi:hypothetical protein DPEC_G00337820 [Dallia pectoralis]|uniref:Uncharacterized protein n=1 Tax=Dallia pectoralis TaxID=75939 RepID=A0ACC2F4E7_DALPE|nr:hypothetical protein DPEC_G00337820 [Dallia pectoralis]
MLKKNVSVELCLLPTTDTRLIVIEPTTEEVRSQLLKEEPPQAYLGVLWGWLEDLELLLSGELEELDSEVPPEPDSWGFRKVSWPAIGDEAYKEDFWCYIQPSS